MTTVVPALMKVFRELLHLSPLMMSKLAPSGSVAVAVGGAEGMRVFDAAADQRQA
jgi:hypothetical protein